MTTYPVKSLKTPTDGTHILVRDIVHARLVAGEKYMVETLRWISVPLLRVTVGLVFVWFGALKVAGTTPVGDLVASTLPLFDRHWLVPALGVFEVLLGVGLLVGRPYRVVLLTIIGHLSGTFLVLVVLPDVAFQHGNPLLLTVTGEFVVKNLVLVSAAIVLLAGAQQRRGRAAGPWRSTGIRASTEGADLVK